MPHHIGTLLLRCDASVAIGSGHVMRSLALAQAWQDAGGEAVFATAEMTAAIQKLISADNLGLIQINGETGTPQDAAFLARHAHDLGARWVVADDYRFGADYQRALRDAGLKSLLVDDGGGANYCSELVLNQNAYAREELYSSRAPQPRLLLGPRFALLRREFADWRDRKREIPAVGSTVLVTMGGSDRGNVTLRVVEALNLVKREIEVAVVVGASNPHVSSIEAAAAKARHPVRVLRNAFMPELMNWADLAISGAGITTAELCLLGVPSILIDIASNQTPVAVELARVGAALHVSSKEISRPDNLAKRMSSLLNSQESRHALSEKAESLVDGLGAQRVVSAIHTYGLHLRIAEEQDCKLLWDWANDPAAREASFSQEPIPWQEHVEWFKAKLRDQAYRIFIATDCGGQPVGAVRFQLDGGRALLSINVDRNVRGQGYGQAILDLAAKQLFESTNASAVDAYVKPDNLASLRLFENAGFRKCEGSENIRGHAAVHFVLSWNGA